MMTYVFVRGIGTWICDTLKEARYTARRLSREYPGCVVVVVWCGEHFCNVMNGKEMR